MDPRQRLLPNLRPHLIRPPPQRNPQPMSHHQIQPQLQQLPRTSIHLPLHVLRVRWYSLVHNPDKIDKGDLGDRQDGCLFAVGEGVGEY